MSWDENDVAATGYRNREYAEISCARAMAYLMDNEKSKRLEAGSCVYCFHFGGGMAGQAFTAWKCRVCEKDQRMWPNTAHPTICDSCSKAHSLCKRCGADLYLRVRRKATL